MRRGGQRKRRETAARLNNPAAHIVTVSLLASFLLEEYAWGRMAPQMVQKLSSLAIRDFREGGGLADLERLASMGTSGHHSNNLSRDITKITEEIPRMQKPFVEKLPFTTGTRLQSFLLPHETFACLYTEYKSAWDNIVCTGAAQLQRFWEDVSGHPQMENNPMTGVSGWKRLFVPMGFHGDGVPVTGKGKIWCKMMTVFSCFSILGVGNTKEKYWHVWSVFDRLCTQGENGTLNKFFQLFSWSLYWLWQGVWPDQDHHGNLRLDSVPNT